jgi:hypothetical protein
LLIGYGIGHPQVIAQAVKQAEAERRLAAMQESLVQLEAQMIDVRLQADVQRDAAAALRDDLTDAHQKVSQLQEEVTFYKGLMAPNSLRNGLQVSELELTAIPGEAAFNYQLLLTQVALRRSVIAGEVRMDVIGYHLPKDQHADAHEESVLSLTELSDLSAYPLKFRFRYFQDLAGRLTLPPGFTPQRVRVTASQNGKEPLQVMFPWPASGAAVATHEIASGGRSGPGL